MASAFQGKKLNLHNAQRFAKLVGKDTLQSTEFWLSFPKRKSLFKEFQDCKTLEEYYDFSVKAFGLMQHKPEIVGLLGYVEQISPKYTCEIGTYEGGTNFLIGQALKNVSLVVGLDLYVQHAAQLKYFCHPGRSQFYLNGSSHAPITIDKVKDILNGNLFDFVFIDGDHRYDGVKQDFLSYRHLVREGGIIAFHDIVADHKTRYGKDTGMWAGDVPVFWERLKSVYPHREFVKNPEQDGLGIGAIEYSKEIALPNSL